MAIVNGRSVVCCGLSPFSAAHMEVQSNHGACQSAAHVDGARALGAAGGNMGGMANQDRALGTPYGKHPTRALLLGSGELGKEVAIALTRLGVRVIAADSYEGAPAQQVAH